MALTVCTLLPMAMRGLARATHITSAMMIASIGNGDMLLIFSTSFLEFRVSGANSLHFIANGNEMPGQHTHDIGIEDGFCDRN